MTGGLLQLVAYGAQDIYLTGSPTITYFKNVYRRHTNFAMESIQQTFSGAIGFGKTTSSLISRNGDLISGMSLSVNLPANAQGWRHDIGHKLIERIDIEIGGQLIDRHYSDWFEIWAQLTVPASKKLGYRKLIGQSPLSSTGAVTGLQTNAGATKVTIPLQFWFCRNIGLALPLISLQYHEVKVNVKFSPLNYANIVGDATLRELVNAELWVDYIYLDSDERRRFAQTSHEYLIEQVQFTGDEQYSALANADDILNKSITLNFNHPVKELIWVCVSNDDPGNFVGSAQGPGYDNFANGNSRGANPVITAKLQLNGHDRIAERSGSYFNLEQPYKHHTCVPDSPGINLYSFALKPEEHQPSGSCNFSRIDNCKLSLTLKGARGQDGKTPDPLKAGAVKVFAINYNVLRIMSGMGGLAYSN